MTVEYWWYNNSVLWSGGNRTGVQSGTDTIISTISSDLLTPQEEWNCTIRAFDGTNHSWYASVVHEFTNGPPSQVQLSYPTEGDQFFTNRTPEFRWEDAIDPDDDTLTYALELSLNPDISSPIFNMSGILTNFTIYPGELDFTTYYWRVRANDSVLMGDWSAIWNFTLQPELSITIVNEAIEFGVVEVDHAYDTEGVIQPFILRNDGNVEVNISKLSANESLWTTVALGTSYFQFKADNDSTETGSFNWTASQWSWENVTGYDDSNKTVVAGLDWHDGSDTAEIDIRIQVPRHEPPSDRSVYLYVTGE